MKLDVTGRGDERTRQLDAIETAVRQAGATALHVIGSLGRGDGDALSDVDVWVTFPDEEIEAVIANRWELYGEVGEVLIAHEMVPNRPVGGVFSLVIYRTPVGPMEVDWSLAPQSSLGMDAEVATVFAELPVPFGERLLDSAAEHPASRADSISWLVCMLFIAIKKAARGGDQEFVSFLGQIYRDIGRDLSLDEDWQITESSSFVEISLMLRQLLLVSDEQQQRAIQAIDEWLPTLTLSD